MKKIVLAGLILCGVAETLMAQSFFAMRRSRSLILTVGTGTSSYLGELSNPGDYLQANLNFHAGLQYYLTNRIGVRGEVSWFQLSGDDKKATTESGRKQRNLSFTSNNFEISAVGIVNLFPQGRSFYQRPGFNVYGFGGIGLLYFNPSAELQGNKYQLRPQKTELVDYGPVTFVIPMGMGVRFKLGPFANLSLEGGFRKTFTDYLDDVSTTYYDQSRYPNDLSYRLAYRSFEVGSSNKPGDIRGNPKTDDAYMLFSAKLEYYLPINFFQGGGGDKKFKNKRRSFYRYNKRGGLKK